MSKPTFGCLGVILALLLGVSLLLNLIFFVAAAVRQAQQPPEGSGRYPETLISGTPFEKNKIVVIELWGLISGEIQGYFGDTMVDDIREQLDAALEDDDVRAILLRIDSPGGEVTASDIIYRHLSKARETKPISVFMQSVAASGGYYAAMGGNSIVATDTAITGSIGVILQTFNFEDLLGKIGVRALTFKSGKMKDLLSPVRTMSPQEMEYVQALINETYDKFVGIVAQERNLDERILREQLADGRILSGRMAQQVGLVDKTGYFEDAVKAALELAEIDSAKVVRYRPSFDFERLLSNFVRAPQQPVMRVQLGPEQLPLRAGRLYYLSPHVLGN